MFLFTGSLSYNFFIYLFAYIMALMVAVSFHEFSHAFVAKKEGDYTAVALKRYTLAPHAHFDIKGLICMLLFGFGWAKPVPVDSRNFKRGKKSKLLVAIAGIITNLILGIIFCFIYVLIFKIDSNFYSSNLYGQVLYQFLNYSILLNFSLAFFNIIPIYPLDGFQVVKTLSKPNNSVVEFLKKYSIFIYLFLIITNIYYYYFSYTAMYAINGLIKLFCIILGVS